MPSNCSTCYTISYVLELIIIFLKCFIHSPYIIVNNIWPHEASEWLKMNHIWPHHASEWCRTIYGHVMHQNDLEWTIYGHIKHQKDLEWKMWFLEDGVRVEECDGEHRSDLLKLTPLYLQGNMPILCLIEWTLCRLWGPK